MLLQPTGARPDIAVTGYHAYAGFLRLVRNADPAMASKLHDGAGRKPFTVTPMLVGQQPGPHRIEAVEGPGCGLTLVSLAAPVMRLLDAWTKAPPSEIELDGVSVRVLKVVHDCAASFEGLVSDGRRDTDRGRSRFTIRFLTPTTFRSEGSYIPLPVPGLVFGSLARAWTEHALGEALLAPVRAAFGELLPGGSRHGPRGIAAGASHLELLGHRLRLETVDLPVAGRIRGFVGQATFGVRRGTPESVAAATATLARFATFAGVGYRTTWGFGHVKSWPVGPVARRSP